MPRCVADCEDHNTSRCLICHEKSDHCECPVDPIQKAQLFWSVSMRFARIKQVQGSDAAWDDLLGFAPAE